jgi:O-antigen/teichoic acid export membrane protein
VFQLGNVLVMVADPLVKLLLTRFGGLSATAYFDMAMQLLQRLRQLPLAASQVLVPAMAQASEHGSERVRDLYTRSYRIIFAATVSSFCVVAVLVSAISILWIGHLEPLFVGMTWICLLGMALNTIGIPSYYSNLGIGHVGTNTIGHGLIALLLIALGWLGGKTWGAFGVSAGYVIAVAAGGLYVQIALMKRLGLAMSTFIPAESRKLLGFSLLAVAVCLGADRAFAHFSYFQALDLQVQLLRAAVLIGIFALVAGSSIWSHPLRRTLSARIAGAVP